MPAVPPSSLVLAADQPTALPQAARALHLGRLVAFPTETVYGLGADAGDDQAVARIYAAKGRPGHNPLIVHVPDAAEAARFGVFDPRSESLAAAFWPGPLTLVLPRAPGAPVSRLVTAGLATIALRVPSHPVALMLLQACRRPLAAPSANISGRISATTARHVAETLGGRVAVILDGGPCAVGVESTIVGLAGPRAVLLRPGGVPREAIEALIGPLDDPEQGLVAAPGMLASHYAPMRPVRLDVVNLGPDEALLAFGTDVPTGARRVLNLSPRGDLAEAAANLYAYLRDLDGADIAAIAVMPIPEHGLGLALNDRLRRAAAPRDA
jgi:L-threonylcarbamoyladenylate synthase